MTDQDVKKIISDAVAEAFNTPLFKEAVASAVAEALTAREISKAVDVTLKASSEASDAFFM